MISMKRWGVWISAVLIGLAAAVPFVRRQHDLSLSRHRALERVSDLRKSCFPHEVCDPCTPAELTWCYDHGDRGVRTTVLGALLERPWSDVERIVRKAAADADRRLRLMAVTAGPWQEDGYLQLLRNALRDPEDEVRRRAAYVLAMRGDRSGMALLQEDLLSPDGTVRSSSISAICGVGTEAERLEACALLAASPEEHDRCLATYNLGQQSAAAALPRLARLLSDPLLGTFKVAGAPEAVVTSSQGNTVVVTGELEPTFTAVDDDEPIFEDGKAALPRVPDLVLMDEKYGDAYLKIQDDGGGSNKDFNKQTIPFVLNSDIVKIEKGVRVVDDAKVLAIINSAGALESDANRKDGFWIAYALSIYQPNAEPFALGIEGTRGDRDSDAEKDLGGISDGNRKGSLIFQESIRDKTFPFVPLRPLFEQATVVHEIGHQFGLEHGKTGIMSRPHPDERFNGMDLMIIRSKAQSPGSR